MLALFASAAQTQVSYDNWNFMIRAQNSNLIDSLAILGIRPDATSDFDNIYDIPRPPRAPSGNYLEVYFPHSGGTYPPLLGSRYAVDYQGPVDPVWNLSVESSTADVVTIRWDSSYVNSLEPRVHLFLRDVITLQSVDMRKQGSYSFTYTTKRDFQIIGAVDVNLTYLMESFWNGTTQVRDTVTMYLAGASSPYTLMDSSRVFLSDAGTGQFIFTSAASGSYYIVIRHRNHLALWSSSAQSLIKGTTSFSTYDFSTGTDKAFGSNALKGVGAVFVAWGGDVNQDGVVDFLDRNLTWNDRGTSGYKAADCNGDNLVDNADYSIVLANRLRILQRP
jgi:hypothetical protein